MRRYAFILACVILVAGCTTSETPTPTSVTSTPTSPTPTTLEPVPTPVPPFVEPKFDGENALDLVRLQVENATGAPRYRVPATPGNEEVAHIITTSMERLGYDVSWHHFNATYGCAQKPMHNVIAERAGTSGRIVAFGAHYDTRPIADKDIDPTVRDKPILGANDGASGVAVLLELARVIPPGPDTVRFIFFDGEDGGGYKGYDCTDWILGSRAYADTLTPADRTAIRAFILVDMVGDTNLRLPWELNSREGAGKPLQERVYGIANALGHTQFVNATGYAITDDHVPFIAAGIPSLDLIHQTDDGRIFPATHHTQNDTIEHVSAESLAAVGRTLETWWRQLV